MLLEVLLEVLLVCFVAGKRQLKHKMRGELLNKENT